RAVLLAPAVPEEEVAGRAVEASRLRDRKIVAQRAEHRAALPPRLRVHARAGDRGEQGAVESVVLAVIAEPLGLRFLDHATQLPQAGHQVLLRGSDLLVH